MPKDKMLNHACCADSHCTHLPCDLPFRRITMNLEIFHHAWNSATRTRVGWKHGSMSASQALHRWRNNAPVSCPPHQKPYFNFEDVLHNASRSKEWKIVSYQEIIDLKTGRNENSVNQESVMAAVRKVILQFDSFLPPSVAFICGDWQLRNDNEEREMKPKDRFVQYVHLLRGPHISVGQLCMDEVIWIYDDKDKIGFTVATTEEHDEIGEHTLWVKYEEMNKDIQGPALVIESVAASTCVWTPSVVCLPIAG